jgi:hypothetical protein
MSLTRGARRIVQAIGQGLLHLSTTKRQYFSCQATSVVETLVQSKDNSGPYSHLPFPARLVARSYSVYSYSASLINGLRS